MKIKSYYSSRLVEGEEQGKTLHHIEYVDDNNQVVKTEIFEGENIVQIEHRQYSNGKTIEERTEYLMGGSETKVTYLYENDLLKSREEFSNDVRSKFTSYSYNQNNKNTAVVQKDESDKTLHQVLSEYNGSEKVVQYLDDKGYAYHQDIINNNDKDQAVKIERSKFKIDANGKEQEDIVILLLTYDAQGNVTSQEVVKEGKMIQKLSSVYNSKNLITEEKVESYAYGHKSVLTYDYNKEDKLISKMELVNDKLAFEETHSYSNGDLIQIDKKELVDNIYHTSRTSIEIK